MRKGLLVWSALTIMALTTMFLGMNGRTASAQDVTPVTATPQPSPTNNGGSAKWTVKTNTLSSHYPTGFDFALEASSSAGKIVEANVKWTHAPGYLKRAPGKIDSSGKITASWDASGGDTMPPWAGVDWNWDLKDEAGNVYETPVQHDEYADTSRVWHRQESEDVIVFWQDGVPNDMGDEIIKAMRERRQFYFDNWGTLLPYKVRAVIFATQKDFASWDSDLLTIAKFTPVPTPTLLPGETPPPSPTPGDINVPTEVPFVGGVFVAGRLVPSAGITSQVYLGRGAAHTAYAVVLHEVAHLYQSFTGASSQGVDWFIEGDADYFGMDVENDCVAESQYMARIGTLPTLQGEGPSIRGTESLTGYHVGCAFFYWLADTYGEGAHIKLWTLLGKGMSRVDALQEVTGLSFVDMDTAFRKWLGATNAVAATPAEFPTLQFPPTRGPKATKKP
jgi:hypothetical protein